MLSRLCEEEEKCFAAVVALLGTTAKKKSRATHSKQNKLSSLARLSIDRSTDCARKKKYEMRTAQQWRESS
jgi:hypothetical protein